MFQDYYDSVFPGHSLNDLTSDAYQVETTELNLILTNVSIDLAKSHLKVPKTVALEQKWLPAVRTNQPPDRPRTQRQALLTLQKRNMDTPDNNVPVSLTRLKSRCLERFLKAYCVPDARARMEEFKLESLGSTREGLKDWVADQAFEKVSKFTEANVFPDVESFNKYEMMIKPQPKNSLEQTAPWNYSALQNIVCHRKEINALFSPIFRLLFDRFASLLKPKVYCHLRKDLKAMNDHLNAHVQYGKGYKLLEIDQEKYDKSQTEVCYEIELFFLRELGLDEELLQMWGYAHSSTTAMNFLNGIMVMLFYQRKTGDSLTCFGNTLISMVAMASSFDINDFDAAYFVGDDSFLFMNVDVELNRGVENMAKTFNLVGKVISTDHGFFCSLFFVHNGNSWRALPDVLKRIERLSKPLNSQSDTLADRYESLKDMCSGLDDYSYYEGLNRCLQVRYNTNESGIRAIEALYSVSADYKKFELLYKSNPRWINNVQVRTSGRKNRTVPFLVQGVASVAGVEGAREGSSEPPGH